MKKTNSYTETEKHIPGGIMSRIVSYNRLREFKDAWTLLPSFYDTTKIVGGILVCIVQGSVAMEQRSISPVNQISTQGEDG